MTDQQQTQGLTYKDAGVDIDAGNALVDRIKHVSKATRRPEVLGGLGGFGALCEIPEGYRSPVLVSGTDGVGTKLRLAMQLGRHDTIGIDLVAMCSNDIAVVGAEPLLFWIITLPASSTSTLRRESLRVSAKAASWQAQRLLAVKRRRCLACMKARTTILLASVSALLKRIKSSTAIKLHQATSLLASPPQVRIQTVTR